MFFHKNTFKQLEKELEVLKANIVEVDSRKGMSISKNTMRSTDNEMRINGMEKSIMNLTAFSAAVYLYMKSQNGFNEDIFMKMLANVSKDLRRKVLNKRAKPKG
jgi:DNA-binding transcriptional regulator YhcF (GntR family)